MAEAERRSAHRPSPPRPRKATRSVELVIDTVACLTLAEWADHVRSVRAISPADHYIGFHDLTELRYHFGEWHRVTSIRPILQSFPAHLQTNLTRPLPIKDGGALRAVEEVSICRTTTPRDYSTGSSYEPHCESALLTFLCQTTHDLLVPVEPVSSWCLISRSQYNWAEESHQVKGEAPKCGLSQLQ
jgi:hypothetical protein